MQKVTTAERQFVLTKLGLALEERFEVVFEEGSDFVIQNKIIPLTAHNTTVGSAHDVKPWFVVAPIEVFKESHNFRGEALSRRATLSRAALSKSLPGPEW